MSLGTTLCTSPTMPRSATEKIGASPSLLTAMMLSRALHADEVLRRARDAERDVDLRLHGLAGLTDLLRVRHPARVDDRARRARRALEQLGELLDERLVVLGRCRSRGRPTRRPPPLRASGPAAPRRGARAPWPRPRDRVDAADAHDLGRAAATRLGRERLRAASPTRYGFAPVELRVDERVAAEDRGADRSVSPSTSSVGAVGEHRPVELHRQPRDRVAAVVGLREQDRRRAARSPTSSAIAAAPTTPASASPWSTRDTFVAPYSPSGGGDASASVPDVDASTVSPISRALVSSSSVAVVGLSPSRSAYTQIFASPCSSDHLQLLEERDDLLGAVPSSSIFSPASRAGAARRSSIFWRAPAQPTCDASRPRSAARHLVDRLVLRRHDPLERRVRGSTTPAVTLTTAGSDASTIVVAGLGLALDLDLAVGDLDVLRERERRPAEQLGDLRGDRAGVAVGRLGRGEHEVDVAGALDALGEHLRGRQRVGALRARRRRRGSPWPHPSPARCAGPTPRRSAPSRRA